VFSNEIITNVLKKIETVTSFL